MDTSTMNLTTTPPQSVATSYAPDQIIHGDWHHDDELKKGVIANS